MKRSPKKKQKTISKLKSELDRLFSIYIRKSYSNDYGQAVCYTCGKVDSWQNLQNGHFISRAHMNTRYDERNCRVQCVGCNVFKSGNMVEYSRRLLKELGENGFTELTNRKDVIKQFTRKDYESLIDKYKVLTRE